MRNCACVSFFILCLRFQYRICFLRRFFGRLHRLLLPEVPLLRRLLTWAYFINKCICQQNLRLSLKRCNSSNFCLQNRIAHQSISWESSASQIHRLLSLLQNHSSNLRVWCSSWVCLRFSARTWNILSSWLLLYQ